MMIVLNLEVVIEMGRNKQIQETRGKSDKTDLMNLTWRKEWNKFT